jgi:hypothetical protein
MSAAFATVPRAIPLAERPTKVVLRRFRTNPRDVIALMYEITAGTRGLCTSFTKSGGFGGVDYHLTVTQSVAVHMQDADVVAVIDALKDRGYRLAITVRKTSPRRTPEAACA